MSNLIKIKDVSNKYDITARTLRYYEDMGLISSTRSDGYAYRLYDENSNPFSLDDPRNEGIYKNMSFVLSTYLNLDFDYVFLSSVRMIGKGRESLLNNVTATDYMTIGFTLTCSEKTLTERHRKRRDDNEVSFKWLRMAPYPNDYVINTDDKTVTQIVNEIKNIIGMGISESSIICN